MSATSTDSSPPNLAAILLIKRKLAAKNNANAGAKQTQPLSYATSYSQDKLTYRQDAPGENPKPAANTSEPPKASRKTKQIEVSTLDKKMEEINRKQEVKTNETAGSWKGFDAVNYGISSRPESRTRTPVQPVSKKQPTPTRSPSPKRQPTAPPKHPEKQEPITKPKSPEKHRSPTPKETTPKRDKTPVEERPRSKSPVKKKEEPREKTPTEKKPVQKQPTSPPPPRKKTAEKQPSPTREKSAKKQPSPPPEKKTVHKHPSPPPREKTAEKHPSPPPPREKTAEKQPSPPPPREKTAEKQPSPPPPRQKSIEEQPPTPPPRRPKTKSPVLLEKMKSFEEPQSRSEPSLPAIENRTPISPVMSNPQILPKNVQPSEPLPATPFTVPHFKLFPDIKQRTISVPKNAHKSIQRSMDRYRFHVW